MKNSFIECDYCKRNLSPENNPYPDYRLCLSAEQIPTGIAVYDIFIERPLCADKHFCGFGCLTKWCVEGKYNEKSA